MSSTPRSFLLLLLVLAPTLLGARAGGAQPVAEPPSREASVRMGTLSNGLRFFIQPNREPRNRAEFRLVVDAGSVLEDPDQLGLAHVLEHMAFNGTRKFERQELVGYLERVGMRFGPDVNAYTSFDETVYTLTLPTDSAGVVETGMQILEDWAWGISLDSLEIEKERGVVIEEWRLSQGAGSRLQNREFPLLTRGSRYAQRLPIGTYESLRTFDHEALRRFYRDWYRPDLMSVVAVGDFDPDHVEALIRHHFGRIPMPADPRPRHSFEIPDHRETLVSVATDPEAVGSSFSLYHKRRPLDWHTPEVYRAWIVESLASSILTNRLSEITHAPDAPFLDVSSYHGRFMRPLAAYVLTVRVPDGGVERGLEAVLDETQRVVQHGFTQSELEREKLEIRRVMEQRYAERGRVTSGALAADLVSHVLYGGALLDVATEYRLYERFLPEITLQEVSASARSWARAPNRVVLVRTPERDGLTPPDDGAVREIVARAPTRRLHPYEDRTSDAPLVRTPPTPGTIVEEREISAIGAYEWTLSNGVRVLLKPTDFQDDEVLMAARSPGGTSLFDDEDYISALTASAVVQVSGVGELSALELRKRLAGTMAGVGAEIGELYEGLSGAASPQDLETLFQLVHLKFTAPRVDTAAVLAYRTQARVSIESRAASPEAAFQDTLRVVLTQNHPRARPLSPEIFDRLDMQRSLEIYRDRFADAGDFTFYFTGTFDRAAMRPLVERYLASLPSLGRVESGRDLGVRPPRGIVRRNVSRGLEPKALTQIVFTGDFDFAHEKLAALNGLGEALQLRLREILREEMSGTYGASVRASAAHAPWPNYQIAIGFGADPERLEEMTAAVLREVEALRRDGPTEDEMRKVREMLLRSREVELRRNSFWLQQIMSYDRHGWDFVKITQHDTRVATLVPEEIRRAAQRYLDTANFVQVTLLPEGTADRQADSLPDTGGTR